MTAPTNCVLSTCHDDYDAACHMMDTLLGIDAEPTVEALSETYSQQTTGGTVRFTVSPHGTYTVVGETIL